MVERNHLDLSCVVMYLSVADAIPFLSTYLHFSLVSLFTLRKYIKEPNRIVFELLVFEQSESCESVGRFQDPDT